jgi:DNA-binding NarL/FixJ family response regulator
MSNTAQILVADDEALFRKGICYLLQDFGFSVIYEASNGAEVIAYLKKNSLHPDVILMDIKMPELNGIETTSQIAQLYPDIKIIALSSYISGTFITNTIRRGASSYLPKNAAPEQMIETINAVLQNGFYFNSFMRQYITSTALKASQNAKEFYTDNFFTKKEQEVLILLCKQNTTQQIAQQLQLSPRTVEGHRNNLLQKTEAKNIAGLLIFALRYNIISLDDTIDI